MEVWACKMMGGFRGAMARRLSVTDRKMAKLSGQQIDEDGLIGEYAFCKTFNAFCDFVPDPRSGSADCVIGGYRIDVKSTRRANGRLLVTLKENTDVDIYVLAIIEENTVRFPGYATRAEICREENIVDLGHGRGFALPQERLRAFRGQQLKEEVANV